MSMSSCAHNVVEKVRVSKHMDSSNSPKHPSIDRRWHPSQGVMFSTPSCDRSWPRSQDITYSDGTRGRREPISSEARVSKNPTRSPNSDTELSLLASPVSSYRMILSAPALTRHERREDVQCTSERTVVKHDDRRGRAEEKIKERGMIGTVSIPAQYSASIDPFQTNQEGDREAQIKATIESSVIQKGSKWKKVRADNTRFDQSFIPQFEKVELCSRRLFLRPTGSSKTKDFPLIKSVDQQVPIPEINHIELVQGVNEENGSGRLGCSLIAPSASSMGRLSISPTHTLGHVSKLDYPLSEVPLQPIEALKHPALNDPADVHKESGQLEDVEVCEESLHGPLGFQIPKARLLEVQQAFLKGEKTFWQYTLYRGPGGKEVKVHYCQSKEASECVAQLFLDQGVIGFDLEWLPHVSANEGVRYNVSLVQLASEERIALFHIARYEGDTLEDMVAPSLQKIMESPNITKAGVAIKADCTRLRRHMRIDSRGILELSHLYKLVKFSTSGVKKIDKRLVPLAQQVEEHLKLPLWKGEVRGSDWTEKLDYKQIEYAASDAYAGLQLFYALEGKRKALSPSPPRPSHAELNLPIQLADNETISTDDEPLEVSHEGSGTPSSGVSPSIEDIEERAHEFLSVAIEDSEASKPVLKTPRIGRDQPSNPEPCPKLTAANDWIMQWRATLSPTYKPRAFTSQLRAYALWHEQQMDVNSAAWILRDPPLKDTTVASYILDTLNKEKLPFERGRIADVVGCLPRHIRARHGYFLRRIGIEC